jgi:hypothetical protein
LIATVPPYRRRDLQVHAAATARLKATRHSISDGL